MNTVKQWRSGAYAVGLAAAFLFTGCGGGGGGGSSSVAPASLNSKSYTLFANSGETMAVTYASATRFAFQNASGQTEGGNYTATHSGNNWTTTLISDAGGQQILGLDFTSGGGGTFTLHRDGETDRTGAFSARDTAVTTGNVDTGGTTNSPSSGGTSTGTTTGATDTGSTSTGTTTGPTSTGTSTGTTSTGSTTTGSGTTTTTGTTSTGGSTTTSTSTGTSTGSTTTGTTTTGTTTGSTTTGTTTGSTTTSSTTGGTGTGSTGAYTGFAPASLAGRTMFGTRTFTSTGPSGQTHTYTFTATTFHDSDSPEESGGNYTYNASNSHATLDLHYTTPATFVGDHHVLSMTFTAKDQGTFESNYTRGDGTQIVINGTFEIQ